MAEIEIREAGPADAAVVTELVRELARSGGEHSPIEEDYARSYLEVEDSRVLLAVRGSEVVGLLSYSVRPNLFHAGPCGLVEELVVREGRRGQGVGGLLLRHLLERCRSAGCAEVSISTMPGNRAALALYRRLGFADEAVLLERHFRE
jgi:ribosomal protein S18 acetylase RimI-like enzyme